MKYRSVFDIIGPIMIGPSSSHTAGAARIGLMARHLFGKQPQKAEILFQGSFAKTYKGHGTDIAIIGGILGLNTFDKRIVDSYQLAQQMKMEVDIQVSEDVPNHPNTACITLSDDQDRITVQGISIGGGKMEITGINKYAVRVTGEMPTLLVWHEDRYGVVASVSRILATHRVNIGYMEMARLDKGSESLMVIEADQALSSEVCHEIEALPYIHKVISMDSIS